MQVKDILGYEGLYQVTSSGKVFSLPKGDGNGNRLRELKTDDTTIASGTYSRVTLCKSGECKRQSVHRLVAQAFIPNPASKPHVNHIDNNPQNNHYSNLEWCTHAENMEHAQKQGRLFASQSAAGKKAGEKAVKVFDDKMQLLLGKQFLSSSKGVSCNGKKTKRMVTYLCRTCNEIVTDRVDNASVKIRKGECRPCHLRNKI